MKSKIMRGLVCWEIEDEEIKDDEADLELLQDGMFKDWAARRVPRCYWMVLE